MIALASFQRLIWGMSDKITASMGSKPAAIELKDRGALGEIVANGNTRQKIAKRARIVLITAEGHGTVAIMRAVAVAKTAVWRWQAYFAEAVASPGSSKAVPSHPARSRWPRKSSSRSSRRQ
jgi:hypothetical protein